MSLESETVHHVVARLHAAIEERRDELVALVAELVRRPSLLGQEAEAQDYVTSYLRAAGLTPDVYDLADEVRDLPNAGDSGVPFAGRPNVVARRRGAGGGRSLILNGHVDVVSPEPVSAWSHDPWAAEIVGDRMYGRGAHDMKSGLALNLSLARLLHDLDLRLRGDLIVQSVIEEECTGNGSLDAARRYPADAALVTEPTGGIFTRGHVGVMWFRVRIEGRSAHAAIAWQGVNAIVKAGPLVQALVDLDRQMNEESHPTFAGIEHPINLNVGVISGGDWPSTVPGSCELRCRLSFYPGRSVAETRARVEAAIRAAAEADEWLRRHPPVVTYDGFGTAGSLVELDQPALQLLGTWHRRITGADLESEVGTGVDDSRYFNFAGIPAGCYGTIGGNGHAADEWLDLTSLVPTAKVLAGFLVEWCGVAG